MHPLFIGTNHHVLGGFKLVHTWSALNLTMDETLSGFVSFSLQVEENTTNASLEAQLEFAQASLLL